MIGAFEKSTDAIKQLISSGVAVSINTTVTHDNINSLEDLIDSAAEFGCSSYKAITFVPAGRGHLNSDRLKLSRFENYLMGKIIVNKSKEYKGKMSISTETTFEHLVERKNVKRNKQQGTMGCSAGNASLSIGSDGTLYPCPFFRNFPLGNILQDDFKDIWNNHPILRKLRSIEKSEMEEPCRSCSFAPDYCMGGCRASAFIESGNLFATDPNCFATIPVP